MRKYGLIGYPLSHSFSKKFFTEKFAAENIDAEYLNFEISDIGQLPEIIENNPSLTGLNVTIPYKEKVIPFLDKLDAHSEIIGAVNTIRIERESGKTKLTGFNTDIYGFEESLKPLLIPIQNRALILGTGGASKAICFVLKKLGIDYLTITRNVSGENQITYPEVTKELIESHHLIINTTPLGTYPDTDNFPPLPYGFITPVHLLYDLVYNPAVTKFMKFGIEMGATVKNGYQMLELQALKSYEIWNKSR